jgi:hypothetical protein
MLLFLLLFLLLVVLGVVRVRLLLLLLLVVVRRGRPGGSRGNRDHNLIQPLLNAPFCNLVSQRSTAAFMPAAPIDPPVR